MSVLLTSFYRVLLTNDPTPVLLPFDQRDLSVFLHLLVSFVETFQFSQLSFLVGSNPFFLHLHCETLLQSTGSALTTRFNVDRTRAGETTTPFRLKSSKKEDRRRKRKRPFTSGRRALRRKNALQDSQEI